MKNNHHIPDLVPAYIPKRQKRMLYQCSVSKRLSYFFEFTISFTMNKTVKLNTTRFVEKLFMCVNPLLCDEWSHYMCRIRTTWYNWYLCFRKQICNPISIFMIYITDIWLENIKRKNQTKFRKLVVYNYVIVYIYINPTMLDL